MSIQPKIYSVNPDASILHYTYSENTSSLITDDDYLEIQMDHKSSSTIHVFGTITEDMSRYLNCNIQLYDLQGNCINKYSKGLSVRNQCWDNVMEYMHPACAWVTANKTFIASTLPEDHTYLILHLKSNDEIILLLDTLYKYDELANSHNFLRTILYDPQNLMSAFCKSDYFGKDVSLLETYRQIITKYFNVFKKTSDISLNFQKYYGSRAFFSKTETITLQIPNRVMMSTLKNPLCVGGKWNISTCSGDSTVQLRPSESCMVLVNGDILVKDELVESNVSEELLSSELTEKYKHFLNLALQVASAKEAGHLLFEQDTTFLSTTPTTSFDIKLKSLLGVALQDIQIKYPPCTSFFDQTNVCLPFRLPTPPCHRSITQKPIQYISTNT